MGFRSDSRFERTCHGMSSHHGRFHCVGQVPLSALFRSPTQLGQFNIPMDKRHVYDWDTRVPFAVRGPGVLPGTRINVPATLVDLAPTLMGIAGVESSDTIDGRSLLPFLVNASDPMSWDQLSHQAQRHLASLGARSAYVSSWRTSVFLAHFYVADNTKCFANCSRMLSWDTTRLNQDVNCADLTSAGRCWSTKDAPWRQIPRECSDDCFQTESMDNNFIAVRHTGHANSLYVEFQHGHQEVSNVNFSSPNFVEYFDVAQDAWMMRNVYKQTSASRRAAMHEELHRWWECSGSSCP